MKGIAKWERSIIFVVSREPLGYVIIIYGMKFEFDWENPNLWSSIGIKFYDLLLIILPNLNLIIVSVSSVFKL